MMPAWLPAAVLLVLAYAAAIAGVWRTVRGTIRGIRDLALPIGKRRFTAWERARPMFEGAVLIFAGYALTRWSGYFLPG